MLKISQEDHPFYDVFLTLIRNISDHVLKILDDEAQFKSDPNLQYKFLRGIYGCGLETITRLDDIVWSASNSRGSFPKPEHKNVKFLESQFALYHPTHIIAERWTLDFTWYSIWEANSELDVEKLKEKYETKQFLDINSEDFWIIDHPYPAYWAVNGATGDNNDVESSLLFYKTSATEPSYIIGSRSCSWESDVGVSEDISVG